MWLRGVPRADRGGTLGRATEAEPRCRRRSPGRGGGSIRQIEGNSWEGREHPNAAPSAAAMRTMTLGNCLAPLPAPGGHMARRK